MLSIVRYFSYLWLLIIALLSCKEEEDEPFQAADQTQRRLIILNEGNFQSANASIDLYYPESNSLQSSIYHSNNQNRPLGDVAQSMQKINGNYWVVLNNSEKIEILDPTNFRSLTKIGGLNSPRYVLPINQNKAYVSDLFQDEIYVVDPVQERIVNRFSTNGWTEEMLLVGQKAFVCNYDQAQLMVIDVLQDTVMNLISTAIGPNSLAMDKNGMLWLACSGGINQDNPKLVKIDPDREQVTLELEFPNPQESIGDLKLDPEGDYLYFLKNGLYRLSVNDTIIPQQAYIASEARNFYALGIDPINGDIYLSDAIDYQQRGEVYRYDQAGQLLHQFKAGLIPSFFYFD